MNSETAHLYADMEEEEKKQKTPPRVYNLLKKKKDSGLGYPEIEHFDYKIKTRSIR